jgi:hypothetical protein
MGQAAVGPAATAESKAAAPIPKPPLSKEKILQRLSKRLDEQARTRRREQEARNRLQPPRSDAYVCAFCEFEMIQNYPPKYLIREHELKERRSHKEAEKRKRLLDKAKAKRKKGKKGKNTKAANEGEVQASLDNQAPPMNESQSQETRSDAYDEDYTHKSEETLTKGNGDRVEHEAGNPAITAMPGTARPETFPSR